MKIKKFSTAPLDAKERMNIKPIICYPIDNLNESNLSILHHARKNLKNTSEIIIPPRDAKTFEVKKDQFFRIESIEGPQVGDLNIFQANNLEEKFYSGKTRALYGTHLSTGDRMLSSFPYLRSLATINMTAYQGAAAAQRIFEVIDKPIQVKEEENLPNLLQNIILYQDF